MQIVEILIEVVKYALPSLVIYFLMRQYTSQQTFLLAQQNRKDADKDVKALRFQAYERLIMFVERTKLSDLIIRLNTSELDANALKTILLVSVQKEYEHNITQQLYVSGQLWKMIELYKDQTINAITQSYINMERQGKDAYVNDLYGHNQQLSIGISNKVKAAIRKEIELYFDI